MKILLIILAVTSTYFSMSFHKLFQNNTFAQNGDILSEIQSYAKDNNTLSGVEDMLRQKAPTLSNEVVHKVITALTCANQYHVDHNDILTVIDYSLPSNEKRLWVFDLKTKQVLFNTYVSHGINSGAKYTNNFSNKNNSKASSMGIYTTNAIYFGRDGLSLRLDGLERGFNDNANARYVVMHGGWYVNEPFIKKYGRAGRSWGCPALPLNLSKDIIQTIKDKSFFVVYYPSEDWFAKSRFLNCGHFSPINNIQNAILPSNTVPENERGPILFADLNKNSQHEENEPVLTVPADKYQQFFHKTPPLERMLRRQINNEEYIVLSEAELSQLVANEHKRKNAKETKAFYPVYSALTQDEAVNPVLSWKNDLNQNNEESLFDALYFVIPVIKSDRGYYKTEMHILPYGKVKDIQAQEVRLSGKNLSLKTTNQFIRWLGL